MPIVVALLFNLLALRAVLLEDAGRHIRHVRIVVFDGAAADITDDVLQDVVRRIES